MMSNGPRHDEARYLMKPSGAEVQPHVDLSGEARPDGSMADSAMWLIAAKTAAFAFSLAVPLLLVRELTVREFGVYKQLFLLLDTAIAILPLGFAMSAFYFFPREPARRAEVVWNILFVHLLMGALGGAVVAVFPGLPATVLNSPDVTAHAPAIGIAILLAVGSSFVESVAIANGEARRAARIILTMHLLRSASLVAAGVMFGSLRALLYAAIIHGFVYSAVMVRYVRGRSWKARTRVDWRLMRAQLAYALPLTYMGLLWWLQMNLHQFFVSNRYGAVAFAIYAVGCFQLPILGIVLESVGAVMIRRVSVLRSRNATGEIVRLCAGGVRMVAAVAFPLYVLLLVMGRELITVLFTEQYQASWPIFAFNLTLIPLSIIIPAFDAVFRASPEHVSFLLRLRTALLVPLVGGFWIVSGRLGLLGPIAVVVGVNLAERVLISLKVARILGMTRTDLGLFRDVAKLGVAAGTAGLATAIARYALLASGRAEGPLVLLAIGAGIFGVVHVATVLALGVLTSGERARIQRWLDRALHLAPWRSAAAMPEREAREPSA